MTKVRGVKTADTHRDITALLNSVTKHPTVLLALAVAESDLHEHAERRRPACDTSFGLVQQSVCFLVEHIPGVMSGPGNRPPAAEIELIREWYWDAEHALKDAGPRIDALMTRWADPLEALCRWNAPAIPSAQNQNRANYQRGIAAAQQYAVTGVAPQPAHPVQAQGQFDLDNYDTSAEWARMQGSTCSAASLAAVLTAYGKDTNITAALRLIRSVGDDVTAEDGLLNRLGQSVAIERVLDAQGIPSTRYLWDDFTRHTFMEVLDSGRPIVLQVQKYLGRFGHYLVATGVLPGRDGVTVADSNAGAGKRTQYKWDGGAGVGLWSDMAGGTATWADLVEEGADVAENDLQKQIDALKAQVSGLTQAVAVLADDQGDRLGAVIKQLEDARKEGARVRAQFIGPRPS